ncbi:arabinogalactan type I oligomer exo-hydrolase [Lapidilactobacillus concavus DSM 17758]|uniref:Beta-galactosidase n=1 Tax=Lapidilactobacillus concavus DSM 17758 TaxID=1423735 RepID=A0A0R1W1R0_9LACO|nr:beta-galactosidase [Lapidilactobacillus concavus]KRM11792.1 arabinogalactan type I oligomer exo-hydrolase [Lapidilactobacillus concavus DSM 17758]GEL13679.1 beta-galactosidase GanA [Lapidilactobacillus concavus]
MTDHLNKFDAEQQLLYGGDYNPDQWLDRQDILARDLELMKEAKINTVTVGVFAWGPMEPTEGQYNFGWLDCVFDDVESMNGHIILATPSGGRPQWLSQKYPEVNRVDEYGRRHSHGFRHNHCYSSPIYRQKVQEMNTILAKRYGKRQALLMWHVSNEYSGECYCELCQANWRQWLQKKYQTLDALNKAWCLSVWSGLYSDWSQVLPPSPLGETKVHGMDLDWKRFVTHMTIDFYEHEVVPSRELTPEIPCTTNFMAEGQGDRQFVPLIGLDYSKFAKHVDVVSWDSYPDWHNEYESTAETAMKTAYIHDQYYSLKHRPFLVMESTPSTVNWAQYNKAKQPGMNQLSSLQQIAHGSDSTLCFQIRQAQGNSEKFHGAVIGHDGSEQNRVFKEAATYGRQLAQLSEIKGARKQAKVALLYDWESNWALNRGGGFGRPTRLGIQMFQKHYSVLWGQDIACEIVTPESDLNQYKLVIAPMLYLMKPETMAKLRDYVQEGGRLVSSYFSAVVDEYDRVNLGGFPKPLQELFGITTGELDTLLPQEHSQINFDNQIFKTADYNQLITPTTAISLTTYQDHFYQNTTAITSNQYGKGMAYYLGTRLDRKFLTEFYGPIFESLGLQNTLIEQPKFEVSCQTRVKNGVAYHFFMNFSEELQTITTTRLLRRVEDNVLIAAGDLTLPKYGTMVLKENQ